MHCRGNVGWWLIERRFRDRVGCAPKVEVHRTIPYFASIMVRGAASNKRTAGKRGQGSIPQKRAKKKDDYDDAGDAFFLNDEDDKQRKGGAEEEDEEEEVQETADELRLRLGGTLASRM